MPAAHKAYETSSLRRTSQVKEFPFNDPGVTWILVMNDGRVFNPFGTAQRRDAATIVQQRQGRLFIAWPGRTRSDLFQVDQEDKIDLLSMGAL